MHPVLPPSFLPPPARFPHHIKSHHTSHITSHHTSHATSHHITSHRTHTCNPSFFYGIPYIFLSILGPTLGADSANPPKSQHPHTPEILHFPYEFLTFCSPYWGPLLVQIQRARQNPSTRTHLKSLIPTTLRSVGSRFECIPSSFLLPPARFSHHIASHHITSHHTASHHITSHLGYPHR